MRTWEHFLKQIESKFEKETVEKWIHSLKIDHFDARNLYLQALDPIHIAWFEEHIRPYLKKGFCNNNGIPIQVHLSLPSSFNSPQEKKIQNPFLLSSERIDQELTFESFVPAEGNLVAYKLLSDPERSPFNPIYLYGPSHSGKTHLLNATALLLQSQGKKVFFVRAETFTSHVVQAIRLGQMQQFRTIYRNIDALFVDNIHLLAKKDATQEEFFHTFNTLHLAGKPIFLTAIHPPSQLIDIEPRLMSRFEWGLSLGIAPSPSEPILVKKAAIWKIPHTPELLHFLASRFPDHSLEALQALSIRARGPLSLTPEKALIHLQDFIEEKEALRLDPDTIIAHTAKECGIRPEDILGKSQAREHALPRQIAMFFCREKLDLPYQKIGEIFGRDHSTVMGSIRQVKKGQEEKDPKFVPYLAAIEKSLV